MIKFVIVIVIVVYTNCVWGRFLFNPISSNGTKPTDAPPTQSVVPPYLPGNISPAPSSTTTASDNMASNSNTGQPVGPPVPAGNISPAPSSTTTARDNMASNSNTDQAVQIPAPVGDTSPNDAPAPGTKWRFLFNPVNELIAEEQRNGNAGGQSTAPVAQSTTPQAQPTAPGAQSTTSQVQPTAPEAQYTAPEVQQTVPSTQYTAPGAQNSAPEVQQTVPEVQPPAPYGQYTPPDAQYTAPGVQPPNPDGQSTAPGVQQTVPEVQQTVPEVQPTVPPVQQTVPDLQYSAPDGQSTAPDAQSTAPGVQPTTPEVQPTAPEVQPTVPDVQPAPPEVQQTVPEVQSTTTPAPDVQPITTTPVPVVTTLAPSVIATETPPHTVDYCKPDLCPGKKHFACGNSGAFASICSSDAAMVDITPYQAYMVERHNYYRNQIATGKVDRFSPALRMATMVWDVELAELACFNVKQCQMKHDPCHNTDRFQYAGQNLAWHWSSKDSSIDFSIDAGIDGWFKESNDASMKYIDKYQASQKTIGHFTAMVVDISNRMGCCMLHQSKKGGFETFIACDYALTNMMDYPIYLSGTTASKCSTGPNPAFPGLCSLTEPIDPNDYAREAVLGPSEEYEDK